MKKIIQILGGAFPRLRQVIRKARADTMTSEEYVDRLRSCGIRVGDGVRFRYPSHTLIDTTRPCLVEIGNNVDINDNFTILTHDFGTFVFRECYHDFVNSSGKVTIGSNIVFGRDVTILKGVSIGDNCIIGLGSVVSKSIPSDSVAVGVPAKVICSLEDYYKKRKTAQIREALEFGRELARVKGIDNLKASDFPEEWVLFVNEEEYNKSELLRKEVDFRLKGKIDIKEFLHRPKPFSGFPEFLNAIMQNRTQ